MASHTQRAKAAIWNEEYCSPEKSLEFLNVRDNFMSISKELARVMDQADIGMTDENKIDELFNRLKCLDNASTQDEPAISKNAVRGWFRKDSVPDRHNAIKICFALSLSAEQSKDFLRKGCRLGGFNFREAAEVIYFYCLKNNKPFGAAQNMISKYKAADYEVSGIEPDARTRVLRNVFSQDIWDDESFLNALCANKGNFIGYSLTAHGKYQYYKAHLAWMIIEWYLRKENELPIYAPDDEDYVISNIRHAIGDAIKNDKDFVDFQDPVNLNLNNLRKAWQAFIIKAKSKPAKYDMNQILQKVVPNKMLLRETIWGIPFMWDKKEPDFISTKLSSLNDVFEFFTRSQYLSGMDTRPVDATLGKYARKTMVLLYFLNFIYSWISKELKVDMIYNRFYIGLEKLLDECGMAYIYPADPFDWLILKSVKSFEAGNEDPIEFFNEVLELSFPDDL